MSALFFNIVIDWVMWRITEDQPRGIRWTLIGTPEDLNFADHVALVSHNHQHMQEKTARLSTSAQQVGLKISQKKTEAMMLNAQHPAPVKVNGEDLPTTEEFTNLGSIVRLDGGAGNDIKNRLSKPRNAFRMKNNAWRLSQYSNKAKRRLYQSFVLSTLLYGSECWRMTECDRNKSSNFHTKYLRRTLRIFWPETISKNNFSHALTKRAWRLLSCEGDGDGSDMSLTESRAASPTQPYFGHQKENASGDDARKPGVGLWKGSSNPTAYLWNYSEGGPEKTGVAILCFCPTCLTAFMVMSE